jgi:hypothetical protein
MTRARRMKIDNHAAMNYRGLSLVLCKEDRVYYTGVGSGSLSLTIYRFVREIRTRDLQ